MVRPNFQKSLHNYYASALTASPSPDELEHYQTRIIAPPIFHFPPVLLSLMHETVLIDFLIFLEVIPSMYVSS